MPAQRHPPRCREKNQASLLWSDRAKLRRAAASGRRLAGLRKDLAADQPALLSGTELKSSSIPPVSRSMSSPSNALPSRRISELCAVSGALSWRTARPTSSSGTRFSRVAGRRAPAAGCDCSDVFEKLCALEIVPARIEIAKRLVALDPLREAVAVQVDGGLSRCGERALAFRQYEIRRDTLSTELHRCPEQKTEALARSPGGNGNGEQRANRDRPTGNGPIPPMGMADDKPGGRRNCRSMHGQRPRA